MKSTNAWASKALPSRQQRLSPYFLLGEYRALPKNTSRKTTAKNRRSTLDGGSGTVFASATPSTAPHSVASPGHVLWRREEEGGGGGGERRRQINQPTMGRFGTLFCLMQIRAASCIPLVKHLLTHSRFSLLGYVAFSCKRLRRQYKLAL